MRDFNSANPSEPCAELLLKEPLWPRYDGWLNDERQRNSVRFIASFVAIFALDINQVRYRVFPNGVVFPAGVDSIRSGHHLMVVTRFNLFLQTPRTNAHVECLPL